MLKKLFVGLVVLLVLFLGIYAFWVGRPPIEDKAYLENVMSAVTERLEKERTLTAAENGFLSKRLLPYWGRKGQEYEPDSEVEQVVTEWNEYSGAHTGELIPHENLAADQDYREKRAAFKVYADAIREAFQKPYFAAPSNDRPNYQTVLPNFVAIRSTAQAMSGYAESFVGEGKYDEAVSTYGAILNNGKAQQKGGALIRVLIGVAVQSLALDSLQTYITPQTPMGADQFCGLSSSILMALPSEDLFRNALQAEVSTGVWSLEDIRTGKIELNGSEFGPQKLSVIPGYWKREERLYWNNGTELLKAFDKETLPEFSERMSNFSFAEWFKGNQGLLASISLPSVTRARRAYEQARMDLVATALAYQMIGSYKAEGRYPTLQQIGVESPSLGKALEQFPQIEIVSQGPEVSIKVPFQESWEEERAHAPKHAEWIEKRDGVGIFYNLGE